MRTVQSTITVTVHLTVTAVVLALFVTGCPEDAVPQDLSLEVDWFDFGEVAAYHLKPRRAAQGGDLTPEMWIAPSLQYLPVRILIRDTQGNWIDLTLDKLPLQAAQK